MPTKRRRLNRSLDLKHVRLYSWLLNSPDYLSLSTPARAVLIEIANAYDGYNNGRIGVSVRRAALRCRIAPGTAVKAFKELEEKGFIDCMTKGGFNRKARHASEWRLNNWACDVTGEERSRKFMSWGRQKQNTVSNHAIAGDTG